MPHVVHWNCSAILSLGVAQWYVSPKASFVDSCKFMGGELINLGVAIVDNGADALCVFQSNSFSLCLVKTLIACI